VKNFDTYRSFATTVSQLKICDFSGETFKSYEALSFSASATTTQLLSSGEFCELRYDTIPVKKRICKRFFLYQQFENADATLFSQMSHKGYFCGNKLICTASDYRYDQ
jgi:hypothetical protein